MKLTSEAKVTINGIDVVFAEGTEVSFLSTTDQEMLEQATLTGLPVDLSYSKDGKNYIAGANGKFIEIPKPAKLKAEAKKAKAKS